MLPYTLDTFFDDDFRVYQPARGYRFSIDPILLAAHVSIPFQSARVLDIGCGCGIISLLLGRFHPGLHIIGVEIQEELACFAEKNIVSNGMGNRLKIFHKNIELLSSRDLDGPVDIVVSNPPYKKRGTGRMGGNLQKTLARHEVSVDINLLLGKAAELTGEMGMVALIFPAGRLDELKMAMGENGFFLSSIRLVHTGKNFGGCTPKLVLVSGCKYPGKGLISLPPLFLFDDRGNPGKEYERLLFCGKASHPLL